VKYLAILLFTVSMLLSYNSKAVNQNALQDISFVGQNTSPLESFSPCPDTDDADGILPQASRISASGYTVPSSFNYGKKNLSAGFSFRSINGSRICALPYSVNERHLHARSPLYIAFRSLII
jgi:hypothetical protein